MRAPAEVRHRDTTDTARRHHSQRRPAHVHTLGRDAWQRLGESPALDEAILVITPGELITFVVTGSGNPAHSPWTPVTVRNVGTQDSAALAFTLSAPQNFEIDSGNCASTVLSPGTSCEFQLRARASATSTFEGHFVVEVDNTPFVALAANAVLDCPVGIAQAGGIVADCATGGYYLIASPGGCDENASTPDCSALLDRITLTWGPMDAIVGSSDPEDGPGNTAAIVSLAPVQYPAAMYCEQLNVGGFDDWYLPAINELVAMARIPGLITNSPGQRYWSSTVSNAIGTEAQAATTSTTQAITRSAALTVRCVRRR